MNLLGETRTKRLLSLTSNSRFLRVLLFLALFAGPLSILLHEALFNPDVHFLIPSIKAGWAFHPKQRIMKSYSPKVSEDILFIRKFHLKKIPKDTELTVRAFKEMQIKLNGNRIWPLSVRTNWKKRHIFNLRPFLRPGENTCIIQVSNPQGIPALLVESPGYLRTRSGWKAALNSAPKSFRPVVSPMAYPPKPGLLQEWRSWKWMKWIVVIWLVGVAMIGLSAFIRHIAEKAIPRSSSSSSHYTKWAIPLIVLGLCFYLNISNTWKFPYDKSAFDIEGHVDYVERMSRSIKPPLPTDGWQMYQPPLYYWITGKIYTIFGDGSNKESALKAVQYFGCFMGLGIVVLVFLLARGVFPDNPFAHWLALGWAAFLPVSLSINPNISNEVFSAALAGVAVYCLWRLMERKSICFWEVAGLGVVTGLALLSKFTTAIIFFSAIFVLGLRALASLKRADWIRLLVFIGSCLLICGWFYGRNIVLYKTPFIANWDKDIFPFFQTPTYRSLGSYISFGGVFFHHPERARRTNVPDGLYANFWTDNHMNLIKRRNPEYKKASLWMSITLILAVFPSVSLMLGFFSSLFSVFRRPAGNGELSLLVISIWLMMSFLLFTMKVPTYSTLKAHYLIGLIPVLAVYLIRGRDILNRHVRWGRIIHDACILGIGVISFWIYRFPG